MEPALKEWFDKTDWVRSTIKPHELGMHIADVLKQRIENLEQQIAKQEAALRLALEALELNCSSQTESPATKAIAAIREALAEQPAQQEPWPEEPAGHIAGGVQPSTQQDRWVERWYGSLAEKGWWICCGREHIAHLGTEVSSDEVRKIVDAHNRHNPAAQQQDAPPAGFCWDEDDLCFRTHHGLLCAPSFHDTWFKRRGEFATFRTRSTTGTIPPWREPAQQQEPVNKYCCHLCFNKSGQAFLDRMILCPECGNKRCPKATYHELPCTNSNEPGQTGSIYTSPPASKPLVGLTEDEIALICAECALVTPSDIYFARAIEAKLWEKNA